MVLHCIIHRGNDAREANGGIGVGCPACMAMGILKSFQMLQYDLHKNVGPPCSLRSHGTPDSSQNGPEGTNIGSIIVRATDMSIYFRDPDSRKLWGRHPG